MIKKSLIIFILIFGWWYSRNTIKAQNIECFTQYGICSFELSGQLEWLKQTPLLFPLPHQKVSQRFSNFAYVKSTRLYRRLPHTLVVSVDLRKPMGTLGPQVLGIKAVSDTDGVIIGHQENRQLPHLVTSREVSEYKLGDKLDQHQSTALKILTSISKISAKQVLGRLDDSRLEVVLSDTTQITMDINYLPSNWESTLHLILERSKIQAKVPKTIDLRFSSPIIKF